MTDNEFKAESGRKPRPCVFSREVLQQLDSEQLEKVTDALLDGDVSAPGIARVVKRWTGINVHEQSVLRHRKGQCGCAR